jgi:two-component sensor histidine kinase/CHASE3 domain sensor protein
MTSTAADSAPAEEPGISDPRARDGGAPDDDSHADVTTAGRHRRRHVVTAIAAGFTLLAAACLAAAVLAVQANRESDAMLRDWQKRRVAESALAVLRDAETCERGYLSTGAPAFAEAFQRDSAELSSTSATLKRLTADDPLQARLAAEFEVAALDKLRDLTRAMTLARPGADDAALGEVGRTLMRDAGNAIGSLAADIELSIDREAARRRLLADVLLAVIIGATIGVVVLALVLLRDSRRYLRLLEMRERSLRTLAQSLQQRVAERTRSLSEVNQRLAIALRASGVTVFTQDAALTYKWVHNSPPGVPPEAIIGRSDYDILPERLAEPVIRLKRVVLETGAPARGEVVLAQADGERWYDLTVVPLAGAGGESEGIIAGAVDITQRKRQESHIRLLMRELTHRSKNLLAVVDAIMRQTAASAPSLADFMGRFSARLQSLAASHDLLVQEDWVSVALGDLIQSQLEPYADRVGTQVSMSGAPLKLLPQAAQHIGMAVHELASNAARYGALSTPSGNVAILWDVERHDDGSETCRLSWTETGGPPVESPQRSGFGRAVIERMVARVVRGKVELQYLPTGVVWTLVFPLTEPSLVEA